MGERQYIQINTDEVSIQYGDKEARSLKTQMEVKGKWHLRRDFIAILTSNVLTI